MGGLDLILNMALCLSCAKLDANLPVGLIRLDNISSPTGGNDIIADGGAGEVVVGDPSEGVDGDETSGEIETLQTVRNKKRTLELLRKWINGKNLRIVTLQDYPLSYVERINNTNVGRGVAFELIDFLQEKFNFTYDVLLPEENIIGASADYEKSLIKMLNQSKADLAAAFLPLLTDPRSFVFYSTTTLDEGEWIMVMQRPRESATGSGLLAPFDFWVWILILVSLLAVGPIIYLLIILRNKLTGDTEQKPYSLSHCAWFVYGALMKQGSTLSPVADSTRLLFATWWIFITILTSFYTANLTAFLTLSKFTLPYNTVSDILYKSKQFVTARGGGVEYSIRNTNESLSVLGPMIKNGYATFSTYTNDSTNLQTYVEKNGYVFIRDRPAIYHVLYQDYRYRKTISLNDEKVHCPFAMAKEPFLKKMRAFAYPIGSNLSDLLDPELLNLVESGIVKHLSGRNLPNAEICPQNLGSTERQLLNTDLLLTYYIMFAGFATSMVVFTTELLFRFLNSRNERIHDNQWARHGIGRAPNGRLQFAPKRWLTERLRQGSGNDKERLTSPTANVTPPPPYQSIFNNSNGGKHSKNSSYDSNGQRWRRTVGGNIGGGGGFGGMMLGHGNQNGGGNTETGTGLGDNGGGGGGVRRLINGRDYMVFRNPNGQSQLVPVRAPSAALFQYTYTE